MVELKRNARGPADLNRLNLTDFKRFHKHFKGLPFTVSHRGPDFKRRVKKVSEVSMKIAQDITFDQELNDGSKKAVSIPEYYDAAYSLKLRYPFLPCIGVKAKDGKMIYYPAEICEIVPGRRYRKKISLVLISQKPTLMLHVLTSNLILSIFLVGSGADFADDQGYHP